MKKKYYFPDPDPRFDIFGSENPVCIDKAECKRLAHEYGYTQAEFMRHMHEATQEELITWGKSDNTITRYSEPYNINTDPENIWAAIASCMDDDTRETVHAELAPCTNEEFLSRYLKLDPEFEALLRNEFGLKL